MTDKASGYTGQVIQLVYHPNGCEHANVQSRERTKGGDVVESCEFSILQLEGDAIPKLSEIELKEKITERPSPLGDPLPKEY